MEVHSTRSGFANKCSRKNTFVLFIVVRCRSAVVFGFVFYKRVVDPVPWYFLQFVFRDCPRSLLAHSVAQRRRHPVKNTFGNFSRMSFCGQASHKLYAALARTDFVYHVRPGIFLYFLRCARSTCQADPLIRWLCHCVCQVHRLGGSLLLLQSVSCMGRGAHISAKYECVSWFVW